MREYESSYDHHRSDKCHIQSNELGRDSGANVGADDDRDSIVSGDEPSVHEPDQNHGYGGGGLQDARHERAGKYAFQGLVGPAVEYRFELFPRHHLYLVGEFLNGEKKYENKRENCGKYCGCVHHVSIKYYASSIKYEECDSIIDTMQKDFDQWNERKKEIHSTGGYLPLYHKRQIRWCRLGVNVGFEQDGTGKDFSRPVLILKGFSRQVCLVIPLTTSTKDNEYYLQVGIIGDRKASVIISQIRLIDTRRLDQHIATLDKKTFGRIQKAVKDML